jgi:hypothetical protein
LLREPFGISMTTSNSTAAAPYACAPVVTASP